jgi:hypothetical protein
MNRGVRLEASDLSGLKGGRSRLRRRKIAVTGRNRPVAVVGSSSLGFKICVD